MQYDTKNKFVINLLLSFTAFAGQNLYTSYYTKENTELEKTAKELLAYNDNYNNKILSQEAIKDLSLIVGKKSGDTGLVTKINRTKTYLGYETLKHLLTRPIRDKNILLKRQGIVKKLATDKHLETIEEHINSISKNEKTLLEMLKRENIAESDFLSLATQLVGIDRSETLTELTRLGSLSSIITLGTASLIGSGVRLAHLGGYLCRLYKEHFDKNNSANIDIEFNANHAAQLAIFLASTIFIKNKLIPAFSYQEAISKKMLNELIIIRNFLNSINSITSSLFDFRDKESNYDKDLDYGANFETYTRYFTGLSEELEYLIKTIQTSTFDKASSLKFMGRVRVAHKKFHELKPQLKELLRAVGELDAFLSFARLIEEYKDQTVHYCYTQYLDGDLPIIKFKNAWHPTVEQFTIVSHSLNLGNNIEESNELFCPNIYLTAPNGAGKSTFILQVALNTVLSQTFGCAAADEFTTTLFDSIVIHSNLEHNAKEGQSTYGVEQAKMNELNVAIKSGCNNHKKVLAIIDEPFKSTKEKLASTCLTDFIKDVEFYDKSICMIASHFLQPAQDIEDYNNKRFINLHIPVLENPKNSGKFNRDFKIENGIDYSWFNLSQEDQNWVTRYNTWLAFTKLTK